MADEVAPNVSNEAFPAADVENEVNLAKNVNLEVDPISSEVEATKEIEKEQIEAAAKSQKEKKEKKDALQTLKSAVIVSCVIVALAGAIFAVTKKLKEK